MFGEKNLLYQRKKKAFFLVLIFFFSFFLRFFRLVDYPAGFYQNEASFGYNAYSLLKTGRDEYGKFLPFILESFGDYKLAGFSYFLVPFVYFLGLNEFTVRFSVVFAAMLILLVIYWLIGEIFFSKKIALLTIFLLSISPWFLVFTRTANETVVAMLFFYISIFYCVRFNRNHSLFFYLLGLFFLLLSFFTYYSTWLPGIFLFGVYSFLLINKWRQKVITREKIIVYFLMLTIFGISIFEIVWEAKTGRLSQINFLKHSSAYPLLLEQIREDQKNFPYFLVRIFHNKLVFYPIFFLENYFQNFSFDFLFLYGDRGEKTYFVPYSGVLYLWSAPFFLFGLYHFVKNQSRAKNMLFFSFLGIIFLGSTLSTYGSESQRTLFSAPLFSFLISYGILFFFRKMKLARWKNAFLLLIIFFAVFQGIIFNHQYFWHSTVHQPWHRNYGERLMIQKVEESKKKYQKVIIASDPAIFFYFYQKTDPKVAQKEGKVKQKGRNALGYPLRKKVGDYFLMPVACPTAGKLNVLYVCQGNKVPRNSKIIDIIRFQDNQPAYIFLEFQRELNQEPLPAKIEFLPEYRLIDEREIFDWL